MVGIRDSMKRCNELNYERRDREQQGSEDSNVDLPAELGMGRQ